MASVSDVSLDDRQLRMRRQAAGAEQQQVVDGDVVSLVEQFGHEHAALVARSANDRNLLHVIDQTFSTKGSATKKASHAFGSEDGLNTVRSPRNVPARSCEEPMSIQCVLPRML